MPVNTFPKVTTNNSTAGQGPAVLLFVSYYTLGQLLFCSYDKGRVVKLEILN